MIEAIKKFFVEKIQSHDENIGGEQQLKIATAALLLEMASADFGVTADELEAVAHSIQRHFSLTQNETDALIRLATEEAGQATCYYDFTRLINNGFSAKQKTKVIELLWEVAYADQNLQKYEEALVRKIADLIYVPHSDFIAAKHRVLARSK